MTRFRERNLGVVGLVSLLTLVVFIAGALEFSKLPLVNHGSTRQAYFANAGGLAVGNVVTVHGVKVGTITGLALDHSRVRVDFSVQSGLPLGADTTAAAQVLSPIGTEYLQLTPAGSTPLRGPIPMNHTTIPYNLVTDLSDLGKQLQDYNIPALERAFETGSQSLSSTTSAEAAAAFSGLARFSQVLGQERTQLATVVSQGAGLTKVLSDRSGQLVDLVSQANLVLGVLTQRKAAIEQLLTGTASLGQEITTILSTNRAALGPLLTSLQQVSSVLAQDAGSIGNALPILAAFGKYAANSTGSGAFADVSIPTLLLPDNLIAQCASAAAYPSPNPQVGCRP